MDDRTKGVGDDRMTGIGDEGAIGRSEDPTPRRRTPTAGATERTRGRSDERVRASAGIVDREEVTEERTEQIRSEIEQTRDDMSETIDAIQDRLRPRNVAANAAASVREAAGDAVATVRDAASDTFEEVADSRVVQEVRANPIPAAMVGVGIVGLAWLAFGGRDAGRRRRSRMRTEVFDHGESLGYYERDDYYRTRSARPAASGWNAGAARDIGDRTASAAADIASKTGEYAREAGWRARQTTRRAQNQLQRAMQENPLAVGAAALAVGAIIGMALPETERENELMGETRDNVVESAQEMARDAANRVQEAASDAAQRVQDVASDAVGLLGKDKT